MRGEAAFIQVNGVTFTYPGAHALALDHVTLAADVGCVTCLMGVNGCGKSTLIDCILGDNQVDSGAVLIDGVDASALPPLQLARKVAYVPQVHDRAFPYLAHDVVAMGRTPYRGILGSIGEDDHALVDEALELCGIGYLAERPYTQLSGGEVQMVLLARALAQKTPFILMDEPTAHLDFRNELFFMETIVRLVRDYGVGVLTATHSPNQAFFFEGNGVPTSCALMDAGSVCQIGAPSEVLTAENLRELYGIEARIVSAETSHGHALSQILLVSTEGDSND